MTHGLIESEQGTFVIVDLDRICTTHNIYWRTFLKVEEDLKAGRLKV